MNIKLIKKDGLFGISEDDKEVVPCLYEDKEGAIAEFCYFERLNIKYHEHGRTFLDKVKTLDEISKIENYLLNS